MKYASMGYKYNTQLQTIHETIIQNLCKTDFAMAQQLLGC